jgi:hypothetical protein
VDKQSAENITLDPGIHVREYGVGGFLLGFGRANVYSS